MFCATNKNRCRQDGRSLVNTAGGFGSYADASATRVLAGTGDGRLEGLSAG